MLYRFHSFISFRAVNVALSSIFSISGDHEHESRSRYAQLLPDRIDVPLGVLVHDNALGPFALVAFAFPFSRGIDPHLGAVSHERRGMVEHVHGAFDKDQIALGVNMIADNPRNLS